MYFGEDDISGDYGYDIWSYEEQAPPGYAPGEYVQESGGILDTIKSIFEMVSPVAIAALKSQLTTQQVATTQTTAQVAAQQAAAAKQTILGASLGGSNILLLAGLGTAAFLLFRKKT